MSANSLPVRLSVLLFFLLLSAAAASLGLRRSVPADGRLADLAAAEDEMRSAARLHPPAELPTAPGSATVCRECHPEAPHGGSGIAAAMRNQHAVIMDCLVCHWAAVSGPRPAVSWRGTGGPMAGEAAGFLLTVPADGGTLDVAALREEAAARQTCFDRGVACSHCHHRGGMTEFARPGSTQEKTARLEALEEYFRLGQGEKWYFPELK